MKKIVVILTLAFGSWVHAFDMDKCLSQNGEHMLGMKECAAMELEEADKALNLSYKKLKSYFDEKKKEEGKDRFGHYTQLSERLIKAQRAWILFRDADCALSADSIGGSLEGLEITTCKTAETLQRTEKLERLFDHHTGEIEEDEVSK